jgi:hypothetical protein
VSNQLTELEWGESVLGLPPVSTTLAANMPPVANNGNNYQTADKMKLKTKFIYMLILLPKGVQKKS